jgi:hypothetical protein
MSRVVARDQRARGVAGDVGARLEILPVENIGADLR